MADTGSSRALARAGAVVSPSTRRAAGERSTRQKRALASLLDKSEHFRSAQDLYAELRQRGESVALTTIYNQLAALAEQGDIDALRTESGETLYRRCATSGHHHHLVCRFCGRTAEVAGPAVERWADRVAREQGYSDVTHTVEISGTCADCAAERAGRRGSR
jgi:Fur family ferric uptake transcriptional regulator